MVNLSFLFVLFLYIGRCNTRVVPLNFRISENELIEESSKDEVEILGHSLPDIKQNDDLESLISDDTNKSNLEIPNGNTSSLSLNVTSKEQDLEKKLNFGRVESLALSNLPGKEFNSTSEFISKNDLDSKELLKNLQINETENDEANSNLTAMDETFLANNSLSSDLEQERNIEFAENEEKILNDFQNETSAIFEVFEVTNNTENSLQSQPMSNKTEIEVSLINTENITDNKNETAVVFEVFSGINNTDNFQLQPMPNDTEVDTFLSNAKNITEEFRPNNFTTENMDLKNDSVNVERGIFSGFEFLINSEVARNAAKAMEVFNFSDSLTDHIMEESEFHSFLPSFNPEHNFDSTNQTDLKNEISITNRTGESNENRTDLTTPISTVEKTSTVLNHAETLEIKKFSMPFNQNEPLKEINETELSNLEIKLEGNGTSEVSANLENHEGLTKVATPKDSINGTVSNSTDVGVPECPPPGWCIFGFLSQDTCAVNEHCLGSLICCKIRCSKTCIEIESL